MDDTKKCKLSFALAKMYEDVGDYKIAFGYLNEGNKIRKNQLKYSISQDQKLFHLLKGAQPALFKKYN